MKRYVVYRRGLLRTEGKFEDGCDYMMDNDKPKFHTSIHEDDVVTVFDYSEATLMSRIDYITYTSHGGETLSIKKFRKQNFYNNWFATPSMEFTDVYHTLPANQNV